MINELERLVLMVRELNLIPIKFIISYSVHNNLANELFVDSKGTRSPDRIEQIMGVPVEISGGILDGQMILVTRENNNWS